MIEVEDLGGHIISVPMTADERKALAVEEARAKFAELYKRSAKRKCSSCGHLDYSLVPPVTCPNCHFLESSVLAPRVTKMNNRERRAQERASKLRNRKMAKKLARLPKPVAG